MTFDYNDCRRKRHLYAPRASAHTQAEVFAQIRKLGLTVRKSGGEIRVAFPWNEASAYYTTDLQDALGTARAMATWKRDHATD